MRSSPGAVACHLLMLMGTVAGGWQLARAALIAHRQLAGKPDGAEQGFLEAKIITARFYAEQFLPLATAHLRALQAGSDTLLAITDEQF